MPAWEMAQLTEDCEVAEEKIPAAPIADAAEVQIDPATCDQSTRRCVIKRTEFIYKSLKDLAKDMRDPITGDPFSFKASLLSKTHGK